MTDIIPVVNWHSPGQVRHKSLRANHLPEQYLRQVSNPLRRMNLILKKTTEQCPTTDTRTSATHTPTQTTITTTTTVTPTAPLASLAANHCEPTKSHAITDT